MMLRRVGRSKARGVLLYLHGLGESGLCFEEVMTSPSLRDWSHVAPDLPGYGKSPWEETPRGLEEYVGCLGVWLERRFPEPVVLVGHSMGGVLGLLLAEAFPQQVRAFLNVEGNLSGQDCHFSGKAAGYPLEEWLAGGFACVADQIYRGGLESEDLRRYYASLRFCDRRLYHLHSTELVALSHSETLATRLSQLQCPVFYLAGVPGGCGERSRQLLDEAGLPWQALSPSGHWPFLDQPAPFLDAMKAFLQTLPPCS